jgi:uncharacterized membrane protein
MGFTLVSYKLLRGIPALLVLIGLATAVLRSIAVDDLFTRMEPLRAPMMDALGVTRPAAARRAAFLAKADGKFAAHRTTTLLHILTGAGFLALVPLQLTRRVRTRSPRIHRISGRVAILLALASGLTGLFFGLIQPLAGPAEQLIVGAAGLFLLVAVCRASLHIRAGDVAEHREWMLRASGAALGIASIRIVGVPLDLMLAPRGVDPHVIFGLALWIGWGVTLAVTEWWIRTTRHVPAAATQRGLQPTATGVIMSRRVRTGR